MNTRLSRSRLPEFVSHDEAAAAAAQSALLGAAIASGDGRLLAEAFHDRLHEPFRLPDAPLLDELRSRPVAGSVGVTLSGSGPSVVVWAEKGNVSAVVAELEARLPDARILPLAIADHGTEVVEPSVRGSGPGEGAWGNEDASPASLGANS